LVPVTPQVGRPYYKAETAPERAVSASSKWWTRSQPIRTIAQLPLAFSLTETRPPFKYQQIAEKASILSRLGLSASAIARRLGVTDKTVTKALRRLEDERR
jgi:DNA-binding MarR family transcriptional regulator